MTKDNSVYAQVKKLLEDNKFLRDSDKKLAWALWEQNGFLTKRQPTLTDKWGEYLTKDDFIDAPHFETIRRARADVQRNHPELASSKEVQEMKDKKAEQKGTHIYRETVKPKSKNNGIE